VKVTVAYRAADRDRSETKEALALAAQLGDPAATTTYVLGEGPEERLPAVGRLVVGYAPGLLERDSEGLYGALCALLGEDAGEVVVLAEGRLLQEAAARLAGALGYEVVLDAVAVGVGEEGVRLERPVFGGKARVRLCGRPAGLVLGVKPGSVEAEPVAEGAGAERRALAEGGEVLRDRVRRAASASGLKEARVIVSGGRGVGSREAFAELEALARHVKGAVGASRAAVDQGWARPEQQVGLTGTKVAPEVYVAIGISGASQHLAGMAASRVILAVNADEKAPIVEAADVAFIGDWQAIWPHVRARIGGG
jgi:electron transfer flavoprotein alpha subunit